VFKEAGTRVSIWIGTMIELAARLSAAGAIAETASFFSFGNQRPDPRPTLGMSRDDSGPFLEIYRQKGIYEQDPFASSTRKVSAR